MWRLDFFIRSFLILEFAARCVFHNSIFGLSKCYLYIEVRKYLKLSCQGSNHHPFNNLWQILISKVSQVGVEPITFRLRSSSLYHYTIVLLTIKQNCNKVYKKIQIFSPKITFYMYSLHKLSKTKIVCYTTSISVEKYVNIIQPCFQLFSSGIL
jgi:hypothetical protein